MTTPLFGIHLGNSSGCVGIFKDGKADVLANDSGDRITAAVVSYRNNERVVGPAAKAGMARFAACTVTGNKRLMNVSISDKEVADAIAQSVCKILQDEEGVRYELEWEGNTIHLTPDQVHTQLYKNLHETASSSLHTVETTLPAVLTVPVHFCSASRTEVARAAEEAGFRVLQLIDEPSASLLAHSVGQDDLQEEGYVVAYRVGGASMDVTLFLVSSGLYTMVTNIHHHNVGGHRFTDALATFLANEFNQKYKLDPRENRRSMAKLRVAAETCKHVLSTMNSAHCFVESLIDGVDLSSNVSRARLEALMSPLLPQFLDPVSKAIEAAGITPSAVSKVVVSGGSLKIPRLQQALSSLVPCAEVLGLGPSISPDEVIASGAALQASYLPPTWSCDNTQLNEDVLALVHSLTLQADGDTDPEVVAQASWPVPIRKLLVRNVPEGCDKLSVKIRQDRRLLGEAALDGVTAGVGVNIEISVGREGEVNVTLADQKSNKRISVDFSAL